MTVRRTLLSTVLAVLAVASTACGGKSREKALGAAEPALAPSGGPAAAGTVRLVGAEAEGIVYDPRTKLVAVAVRKPTRLLLLDPTTLAIRRTVPLPGTVRHLQLARLGGPVLVPCESADSLVEVSLPGGATRTTKVGRSPHDAGAAADRIVVGDELGSTLTIVRNGVVERIARDVKQPGGVVGTGSRVAVVDVGAFTVSSYDVTTGTRTSVAPAGAGPTHGVLTRDDRIAVTDTRGNALLLFGLDPLKQVTRFALPGAPYGIAADEASNVVWVTLTGRNEVVGLDLSGPAPREIARYPTVGQPDTVAVAPGGRTLWITGTRAGEVQRITR
ncbi:MAG: YncE family protein [Actinomycetota bacterium]